MRQNTEKGLMAVKRGKGTAPARVARLLAITCVSVAVVVGLAGCKSGIQDVTVATAGSKSVHDTPGGVGSVVAAVDIPIVLNPTLYRGRIQVTSVSVIAGAHVNKGQELLKLDPVALQVSADVVQQQLNIAQGAVANAQRSTSVSASEASSIPGIQAQINALQQTLDGDATAIQNAEFQAQQQPTPQNQAALNSAQQQQIRDQGALAQAQSQLATVQARVGAGTSGGNVDVLNSAVGLDQQLLNIAQGATPTITSPIDGDIAAVNIAQGQSAAPSVPLIEIIDPSTLRVTAKFPISERPQVGLGGPATLTFGAVPGVSLQGKVVSVVPSTADGLTFQAIVEAANPSGGARILPGLTANVSVDAVRTASIAVPRICVLNIDQSPQAFVVDAKNIAHLRTLHVGAVDADTVEVTSGMTAGEHCVTAGNQSLSDGATVRITKTDG